MKVLFFIYIFKLMKNFFSFILLIFLNFSILFSQEKGLTSTLNADIYTSFFEASKTKLKDFLHNKEIIILNQKEGSRRFYIHIFLEKDDFLALDTFLVKLGYLSSKDITTNNNAREIEKKKLELVYLENNKNAYKEELKTMSQKDERYYSYWSEIRKIEKQIFRLNLNLKDYDKVNKYMAIITLEDDNDDLTSKKVSFVNMPGATFSMLFVENPKDNLTAKNYQGYSLRYLFTRGKTYASFGVMKEVGKNQSDTSRYKEILMFSFGQDFYTRHFGRGKNKFLNLYSAYNVGGTHLTATSRSKTIAHIQVFLGLELFKNQYILLDNKVGYYIPIGVHRNLRGITYQFAFNFVF